MNAFAKTVWPSGLRRWLKAPVRKGVGSNPTAVICYPSLIYDTHTHLSMMCRYASHLQPPPRPLGAEARTIATWGDFEDEA